MTIDEAVGQQIYFIIDLMKYKMKVCTLKIYINWFGRSFCSLHLYTKLRQLFYYYFNEKTINMVNLFQCLILSKTKLVERRE